jgi:hypothetical protein
MNITIERLMAKVGHLSVAQDLLIEENAALKEELKVVEAIKDELAVIEKDGESAVANVLERLKKLLYKV